MDSSEIRSSMDQWRNQHHVLLAVIGLFAIISFWSKDRGVQVAFIIFQIFGYCIVLYADVFWAYSGLTLFLALCLHLHLILSSRSATVISCFLMLALLFFPRIDSAWFFIVSPFSMDKMVVLGAYSMLGIVALHALHQLLFVVQREQALTHYLKHSVVELSAANVGFQDYAAKAKETSAREERNRIIREVHDSVGYTLTNITMMMEASKDLIESNPAKLAELLDTTRNVSKQSLRQIRKTLRMLSEDTVPIENPLSVLHRIFTTFELATNLRIQVEYRNLGTVPHMIDAMLFRIIQESLTNAFWHGQASLVTVQFWYDKGLSIIISDNGIGAEHIEEGIGLKSMHEQLAAIGGSVTIGSTRKAGFMLDIWIPERSNDG